MVSCCLPLSVIRFWTSYPGWSHPADFMRGIPGSLTSVARGPGSVPSKAVLAQAQLLGVGAGKGCLLLGAEPPEYLSPCPRCPEARVAAGRGPLLLPRVLLPNHKAFLVFQLGKEAVGQSCGHLGVPRGTLCC